MIIGVVRWTALAVVAFVAVVVLASVWSGDDPPLTLHLRCPGGATGALSIVRESRAGSPSVERQVDLVEACHVGRIDLAWPGDDADLRVTLVRRDGRTAHVLARLGTDIQRDRDGYHVILRITDSAPFLANDRL